jgi:hypothetical protein
VERGVVDWVVLVGISQLSDFVAPNGFGRSLYFSADSASDDSDKIVQTFIPEAFGWINFSMLSIYLD